MRFELLSIQYAKCRGGKLFIMLWEIYNIESELLFIFPSFFFFLMSRLSFQYHSKI